MQLVIPILVVIPLSFNAESFFTFTPGMLQLDPDSFSLKWYRDLLQTPNRPDDTSEWIVGAQNTIFIAIFATVIATTLGTLAAIGLSRSHMPSRRLIMGILISPLIVPIVITGAGMFMFYSSLHLTYTYTGLILTHAMLGTPFVVVTVTATLMGFDNDYIRASYSLGAKPLTTFFKIILPMIYPGVATGALFAFVTSLDEVVVSGFLAGPEQVTLPMLMLAGLRQEINLSILAVATILITFSTILLTVVELLRRRNERMMVNRVAR
ncbi:MAG: putative spermidine/putrescine transport system permease protein [Parasphingorhabdus sp.]|jgi:putative spermidine/putrescine transport system permease protein